MNGKHYGRCHHNRYRRRWDQRLGRWHHALIVLVVRGGFLLGRLVTQVEGLTAAVGDLRTDMQQGDQSLAAAINQGDQSLAAAINQGDQSLAAAINGLRTEVQQSNQTLAALANHTHDTDGLTVFQVPPGTGRQ